MNLSSLATLILGAALLVALGSTAPAHEASQVPAGQALEGTVEQVEGDHWRDFDRIILHQGLIVRTAQHGRFAISFADGSQITMGSCTVMRVVDLTPSHLHLKCMGQLHVDLKTAQLKQYITEFDFSIGRVILGQHGADIARGAEEIKLDVGSVKADELKVAVEKGRAFVHGLSNIKGAIVADPSTGSITQGSGFLVQDETTGRMIAVRVSNNTLMAFDAKADSRPWLTATEVLGHLQKGQNVIVYGRSAATFEADSIFAGDNLFINGERLAATPIEDRAEPEVEVAANQTATLTAGNTIAAVGPGLERFDCGCNLNVH